MKRTLTTGFILSAMLVAALLSTAGYSLAQDESAARPLRVYLEPSKPSVVLGEPVYATARLRNGSAEELRVAIELNPSVGHLTVEVTGPKGKTQRFVPLSLADVELQPVGLAPGGELAAVFPVFFGGRGWTFKVTGSYRLAAVVDGPGGQPLRSEPVAVEVREDKAGRYLFEASAEDQRETGKFLIWQHGDHLRRAHATLEDIIARYPESPLTDYAQLAIGLNLSQSFSDYSIGRVRPSRPDEALKRLRAVDPDVLPDLLRVRLELGKARSHAGLDSPKDARSAIDAARKYAAGQKALERMIDLEIEANATLRKLKSE